MSLKTLLFITLALCLNTAQAQSQFSGKLNDGLYSGETRGALSVAVFHINLKHDTAYLEQFRTFGDVVNRDLKDTLVRKNDTLYTGQKTIIKLIDHRLPVLSNKDNQKAAWKFKVKLKYNDKDYQKDYQVSLNRMMLDSMLDRRGTIIAAYRSGTLKNPSFEKERKRLKDNAFTLDHNSFTAEVYKFEQQFFK